MNQQTLVTLVNQIQPINQLLNFLLLRLIIHLPKKRKKKKEKTLNTIANNNTALNTKKKKEEEDALIKMLSEAWGAENTTNQNIDVFDLFKNMWDDTQSKQSESQKGKTWIFSSLDGSIIGNRSVS